MTVPPLEEQPARDDDSATADRLARILRTSELFASVLSHDLRNPLQSILTAAELLIRRAPDPKFVATATRIVTSGNRMNRMIGQLVDFSRIGTGGGPALEPVAGDMVAIWRQVAEQLAGVGSPRVRLDRSGVTVGQWDCDRITQVATTLLGNALGHGAAEKIVTVTIDGTAADEVAITVHNEGAIPDDLLPKIFEPFQDGDRRAPRGEGLGLGLFITRQIIKAHGGQITVSASPTAGSRFDLRLPRRPLDKTAR
jgi:signal transduction histidine kinase